MPWGATITHKHMHNMLFVSSFFVSHHIPLLLLVPLLVAAIICARSSSGPRSAPSNTRLQTYIHTYVENGSQWIVWNPRCCFAACLWLLYFCSLLVASAFFYILQRPSQTTRANNTRWLTNTDTSVSRSRSMSGMHPFTVGPTKRAKQQKFRIMLRMVVAVV